MENKIELDQFYWHEALDRTHLQIENIDSHLLQHPVLKVNPEIRKHVESAVEELCEAYQKIGTNKIFD